MEFNPYSKKIIPFQSFFTPLIATSLAINLFSVQASAFTEIETRSNPRIIGSPGRNGAAGRNGYSGANRGAGGDGGGGGAVGGRGGRGNNGSPGNAYGIYNDSSRTTSLNNTTITQTIQGGGRNASLGNAYGIYNKQDLTHSN